VHLRRIALSYFTKETGAQWEYIAKWQTNKPYISIGEPKGLPWCTVVSDHDTALTSVQCDLSTGGVMNDPD
jgi:hypothetical protein